MNQTSNFASAREALTAANAARKSGAVAEAIAIYRRLPVLFPGKEAIVAAAGGLRASGEVNEALVMLERAVAENNVSATLVTALADAYAGTGQLGRAIGGVERYLALRADDAAMWLALGSLRARTGDWESAEAAFAQSLSLQPMNLDAALARGDALLQTGRRDEALAAYRRATVLKPDDARGYLKLGGLLAAGSDLVEGKALLLRAIALDPSNAGAHTSMARFYHQIGSLQRAVQSARQAIDLDPTLVAAYSVLGNVLLEAGQIEGAVGIFRVAADLEPGTVVVLTDLAMAENAANNPRAAEKILQRILAIEPDNLEARHMLTAVNGEPVRTVPAGYARQLFNWSAPKYDRTMAGPLKYRAPEEIAALLAEAKPGPQSFKQFLDLGCGTGLVAEALAKTYAFTRAVGVDVAERMADVSRAKGVYDEVIAGEATEVLAARIGAFDLITAIDLFVYVGDLAPLMPLIAGALVPGGMLAYSIEVLADGRYKLQRTGRFGHSQKYVEDLAAAHGLAPAASRAVTLRMENGAGVRGLVGLLQRR